MCDSHGAMVAVEEQKFQQLQFARGGRIGRNLLNGRGGAGFCRIRHTIEIVVALVCEARPGHEFSSTQRAQTRPTRPYARRLFAHACR